MKSNLDTISVWQHRLYVFLLCYLAIVMPYKHKYWSIGLLLLTANWLLQGNWSERWNILKTRPSIWLVCSVFAWHLLGLLWTSDFSYALNDLKIKLPLLLPIVFATSKHLSMKQIQIIVECFALSVGVSVLISIGIWFEWWGNSDGEVRHISLFISHIRLSLYVVTAIMGLLYFGWQHKPSVGSIRKVLYLFVIICFLSFLYVLKSLTGIVVVIVLVWLWLLWFSFQIKVKIKKSLALIAVIIIPIVVLLPLVRYAISFFASPQQDISVLATRTPQGNLYWHDTTRNDTENGFYTWYYLCNTELQQAWNKRSNMSYDGKDKKNNELRFTLIRYLTSKGLYKDAQGVQALDSIDIKLIESGFANCVFRDRYSIKPRLYETFWQIQYYMRGGSPDGHSITQRIEYLKTAWDIILQNPYFGVGTGDVAIAFEHQYNVSRSKIPKNWQLRTHNQYITFIIAFGFIGFGCIAIAVVYAVFSDGFATDFLFLSSFLITLLSFLNEDTLETRAGVSLVIFFFCLYMFARPPKKQASQFNI